MYPRYNNPSGLEILDDWGILNDWDVLNPSDIHQEYIYYVTTKKKYINIPVSQNVSISRLGFNITLR